MPAQIATRPGRTRMTKAQDVEHAKTSKTRFGRWDAALHLVTSEDATPADAEAPSTFAASRDFADRMRAAHPATPQAPRRAEERRQATRERVEAHKAAATTAPQPFRPTYAEVDAMLAKIPAGRYALPRNEASAAGNTVTFFEVQEYRGRKRIVQLIGSVGAFAQQTLKLHLQFFAAKHIGADAKAAAVLFGHETNTCARCGSPLTDEASRKRGLGPKCATKY